MYLSIRCECIHVLYTWGPWTLCWLDRKQIWHRAKCWSTFTFRLVTSSICVCLFMNVYVPACIDVQTLEELSLCVLSRLEEVVKEKHHWREIAEAHVQLLRDFAFQEWLCSQSLEHYYHTWVLFSKQQQRSIHQPYIRCILGLFIINSFYFCYKRQQKQLCASKPHLSL